MNVVGARARRGHAGAAVCSALSGLGGDNCLCCANSYDGDGREMLSYRTRSIAVTVTPPPAQRRARQARRWRSGPGAGVRSGVGETDTNVDWRSTCSQAKKAHSHSHGDAHSHAARARRHTRIPLFPLRGARQTPTARNAAPNTNFRPAWRSQNPARNQVTRRRDCTRRRSTRMQVAQATAATTSGSYIRRGCHQLQTQGHGRTTVRQYYNTTIFQC